MTYKLDLEEQDPSSDLVDSCVYNIIDGDELTIEPVNDVNKSTMSHINDYECSVTESTISVDNNTLMVTSYNANDNSFKYQYSKTTNVSKNILMF